jgi:hypothetical protein
VVGREGDEIMAMGQAGTLWIAATGQRVEGENPLSALSNTDWAAEQLARVARFPHAGDLVLLGAWDGEQVVCFEEQVASHGGLGGPQHTPFILYPPGESLSARGIGNSEEIYVRLVRAYGSYG